MIRTIVALIALVIAILFLPLWVQLALFVVAVWGVPHRLTLFIPAVFSDVLYSPGVSATAAFSIDVLKMTLVVGVLLLVRWLLLTHTRFSSLFFSDGYGMEA